MNFIKLFFHIFLSLFCAAVNAKCLKPESLDNLKTVLNSFEKQSGQINKILNGESVSDFTPQNVFGHSFIFEQTDKKILSLQKLLQDSQGIAPEHSSLTNCLRELNLNDSLQFFEKKSKEFTQLKIELLKKNKKLGDSLRNKDFAENNLPDIIANLGKDNKETLDLRKKLEDSLIKGSASVEKEKSALDREKLSYENELTKLKIEFLDIKLRVNKELELKIESFEKSSQELMELAADIKSKDFKKIESNFYKIEKLWLNLARENYYDIFWIQRNIDLPNIPEVPKNISNKELLDLYDQISELKKSILKNYTERKNHELRLLNQLVTNSNSIRASYYDVLGHSYFFSSLTRIETYKLFKNEITAAPFRIASYFYKKYLFVYEQLKIGKEGYVKLFSLSLMFVLFLVSFFALKVVFTKVGDKFDIVFHNVFKKFHRTLVLKKIYSVWVKFKDNTVPVLWLITLEILSGFDLFDGADVFIRLGKVYLGGMILQSLVIVFLGAVSRLDTGNFHEFKKKANETSARFKHIFLFYFLALIVIEVSVGKVYLYTLIYYIVLTYTLIQLVKESSKWEKEFNKYAEKRFSGIVVEKYLGLISFFPKKLNALFLLIFILIFLSFNILINLTENFEISKKISANLFKKQIEKVEAGELGANNISEEYRSYFSPKSLDTELEYVENSQKLENTILSEVEEWIDAKSDEHSLVVFGDKGIGKTTLLKKVSTDLGKKENLEIKYLKVPAKSTDKNILYKFIQGIFSEEESENFDIYRIDKNLTKKTVVFLDESQNVFLSQTGGFDAYYALMNIINMNTENIFWIMSFNKYSWLYLDRAFGRTKFVRNVFEVTGWSDTKIKELIMKRHNKSPFRLSYDLLINATRSQDEIDKYASIESKFFKLLWELSRGNPRAALFLWLTALSSNGNKVLNVNVPKDVELDGVEKLPNDLLFVIASVLKHENLLAGEIEKTTNLQRGLVRNALKIGLEKNYFFRDERSRYMVDISTQYGLIKYLRSKNFIYGS